MTDAWYFYKHLDRATRVVTRYKMRVTILKKGALTYVVKLSHPHADGKKQAGAIMRVQARNVKPDNLEYTKPVPRATQNYLPYKDD